MLAAGLRRSWPLSTSSCVAGCSTSLWQLHSRGQEAAPVRGCPSRTVSASLSRSMVVGDTMYPDQFLHEGYGLFAIPLTAPWKQVPVHVRRGTVSESRMRENCTYGVMRGRWKPLSAVVRGRRVRKRVREWLPVPSRALLYPIPTQFQFYAHLSPLYP